MTASRDIQNARPSSQHRATMGGSASSVPSRSSVARPHHHTVSLGSLNAGHRVSRRKSSSSMGGVNIAALTAAAKEGAVDAGGRLKSADAAAKYSTSSAIAGRDSSAVVDGPGLSTMASEKPSTKGRGRRASEGIRLGKSERSKSNADDLRCDQCGKTYKHGSCLSKHLWEHTPHWALTSKLLISKHQQVQLLEAAKVLVTMNQEPGMGEMSESALHNDSSDLSSDSPAASGTSDARDEDDEDDLSSRTSTPSMDESAVRKAIRAYRTPKREDSYSSAYSRSYQSVTDEHYTTMSAPGEHDGLSYYRSWSSDRPSTAHSATGGRYMPSEVQSDIASAADGLVSFSLNTPTYGPTHLGSDIPPIPEIPSKYRYGYRADVDVNELDRRQRPATRDHEDDYEGVFGRMEQ